MECSEFWGPPVFASIMILMSYALPLVMPNVKMPGITSLFTVFPVGAIACIVFFVLCNLK